MSRECLSVKDIKDAYPVSFVYHPNPPRLGLADGMEQHINVAENLGIPVDKQTVTGEIDIVKGIVIVRSTGSTSLKITVRNGHPVVLFLRNLPDLGIMQVPG